MYAYFLHYASLSQCSWKLSQTNKEFFDCMLKKSFEKIIQHFFQVIKFNICCEQMGKLIKKVRKNHLPILSKIQEK